MQGDRRRHRVDAHAVFGGLQRGAAGQSHHAGLGGGVVGLLLLGPPAEHRGVVDDGAAAPRLHVREHRAGHAEGAGEGDVEHAVPFVVGHVDHALLAAQAGVVDEHVHAAQLAFGGGHQGLHFFLVGDVAELAVDLGEAGLFLQPGNGLFEAARVDVGNHQGPAAFLGAAAGRREADAGTCGGGDQHRAALEQAVAGDVLGVEAHGCVSWKNRGCLGRLRPGGAGATGPHPRAGRPGPAGGLRHQRARQTARRWANRRRSSAGAPTWPGGRTC